MVFRPEKWRTASAAVAIRGRRDIGSFAVGALLVFSLSIAAAGQESTPSVTPQSNIGDIRATVQTSTTEMTLGRRASEEFERRVKLVDDAGVQEYVDRICQNLARNSNALVPITIKVIDSREVNAVSFPGGFLYINSGLILAVDDDAELASVVAHEIAHVVARDGMKNDPYFGASARPNPVITPSPNGTDGIVEIDGYLIPLKSLGSPRETNADYRGIRYMRRAGYNPRAMLAFLRKMQAKEKTEPNTVLRMFQTHPPTTERIRRVLQRVGGSLSVNNPNPDATAELQKVKALLIASETNTPQAGKTVPPHQVR